MERKRLALGAASPRTDRAAKMHQWRDVRALEAKLAIITILMPRVMPNGQIFRERVLMPPRVGRHQGARGHARAIATVTNRRAPGDHEASRPQGYEG